MTEPINILGDYFAGKNKKIQLSLCEGNNWYYTSNCIAEILTNPISSSPEQRQRPIEKIGYYSITDSIISLKDWNDVLFCDLKIVDTLNLQVVFSKETFSTGDYLNRAICYFPVSECNNFKANTNVVKWQIFDHELIEFDTIGGVFKSKYKIKRLSNTYWKGN
jgi:hypothetical protein